MSLKKIVIVICCVTISNVFAQFEDKEPNYPPYVNQLGYNTGESKRFVCYGADEDLPFVIRNTRTKEIVYEGEILNYEGWFSSFNPTTTDDFVIEVEGHGVSVPFKIEQHLLERKSTKLGYDFFIDVRGFADLDKYDMTKVYGGGPSRDGGAFGLETTFEILQYASNPALFDNWKNEIGDDKVADLIDLILWHAEFAYKYIDYNGPVKNRHGTLGYQDQPRMNYDYWNTLDHLAAVCAAYHSFLKPYLAEETYQKYRKACLDNWEKYDRHKVVRYWTYSRKWVDPGFQEFNEMGNAFGQSIFSNLFMYICEKAEKSPNADKFLKYAQESAIDVITKWDFNNPRHMWWIRNAEHITPQSLGYFMLVAPDLAPKGTKEKLEAWAYHMQTKTANFWKYRKHSDSEWAHPKTKELGGAPALGGSMFLVSHLLNDDNLRKLGWAQVDFVFGVNPVGTHLSNKSTERVEMGGYWEGVENGWPQSLEGGYGELGKVRGTLDGSPLDSQFPIATQIEFVEGKMNGQTFSNVAYATEGWNISNRGWMSTLIFSTLGSHKIKITDEKGNQIDALNSNSKVFVELIAALDVTNNKDKAWIDVYLNDTRQKLVLTETDTHSGIFTGEIKLPKKTKKLIVSYGYLGFEKRAKLIMSN